MSTPLIAKDYAPLERYTQSCPDLTPRHRVGDAGTYGITRNTTTGLCPRQESNLRAESSLLSYFVYGSADGLLIARDW
jgi:hypothetical protein